MNDDKEYITRKELEELLDETKKENKLVKACNIFLTVISVILLTSSLISLVAEYKYLEEATELADTVNESYKKVSVQVENMKSKIDCHDEACDKFMELYLYSNLNDLVTTWGKPNASK